MHHHVPNTHWHTFTNSTVMCNASCTTHTLTWNNRSTGLVPAECMARINRSQTEPHSPNQAIGPLGWLHVQACKLTCSQSSSSQSSRSCLHSVCRSSQAFLVHQDSGASAAAQAACRAGADLACQALRTVALLDMTCRLSIMLWLYFAVAGIGHIVRIRPVQGSQTSSENRLSNTPSPHCDQAATKPD